MQSFWHSMYKCSSCMIRLFRRQIIRYPIPQPRPPQLLWIEGGWPVTCLTCCKYDADLWHVMPAIHHTETEMNAAFSYSAVKTTLRRRLYTYLYRWRPPFREVDNSVINLLGGNADQKDEKGWILCSVWCSPHVCVGYVFCWHLQFRLKPAVYRAIVKIQHQANLLIRSPVLF